MLQKKSGLWASLTLTASIACLLVMGISILGVRLDWFGFRTATNVLGWAGRIGAVCFALALIQLFVSRSQRSALFKNALAAALLIGPLLVLLNQPAGGPPPGGPPPGGKPPAAGAPGPGSRPAPLNDISTDTQNPPVYQAVVALRPEGSNPVAYDFQKSPPTQKKLFPDIAPIVSELSKQKAFERALEIADRMGWQIIAEDMGTGAIEAIASTFFFGFKDDVVIRVREASAGSVVDIRSHSRVGRGDRGKNAARVREFIAKFEQ